MAAEPQLDNYAEYEAAEAKRHNTLAALAYAMKYTIKTGELKPPRLNDDGSEMTGEDDNPDDPTDNVETKYSCLMVGIGDPVLAQDIEQLHALIDPADVIELETDAHITIKYGLHTTNFSEIVPFIKDVESVSFVVGGLSLFSSDKQDVLKYEIQGEDLVRLREAVSILDNTDAFPTYNPHVTVAYLKPGTGQHYLSFRSKSVGLTLPAKSFVFSTPDKQIQTVVWNGFCPTGSGGGLDNSCGSKKGIQKFKAPKLVLPAKPEFISSQKGNVKENQKAVSELTKLAKSKDLNKLIAHPATPSPKLLKYKAELIGAVSDYNKSLTKAALASVGKEPAIVPKQTPATPKQAVTGSLQSAKASLEGTGLTKQAITAALTQDASPANKSRAVDRVIITAAILKDGTAMPDAIMALVNKQDKGAIATRVKEISSGQTDRALKEYSETPIHDLNILSAIGVKDHALSGQAVCYMDSRKVEMGTTSVTGDFRHELGHAIRASWGGDSWSNKTELTKAVSVEYDDALKRVKADPPPLGVKLNHDDYETKYGVVGRRSLDNWEEHAAEHYRLYHREVYRDRNEGGNGKYLKQYRQRHPRWANIWDAHYTAALIGQEL